MRQLAFCVLNYSFAICGLSFDLSLAEQSAAGNNGVEPRGVNISPKQIPAFLPDQGRGSSAEADENQAEINCFVTGCFQYENLTTCILSGLDYFSAITSQIL